MDPLPVSSSWFLSWIYQYLVPEVLVHFHFPQIRMKPRIKILKLKLRKEKIAQNP